MDVYTEHSMTSPTKAKKSLVVVKTLEMSPKRKIFVAREPQGADDFRELTQSNLGNTSPKVHGKWPSVVALTPVLPPSHLLTPSLSSFLLTPAAGAHQGRDVDPAQRLGQPGAL
jgi:hypothetical protein